MEESIDTTIIQNPITELPKAQPVLGQERIEVIDIIRGFALLGILIANMVIFSSPSIYLNVLGKNMWPDIWDTATASFIKLLIEGNFYTIFSFLFGLGFAIFFERAKTKTSKPVFLFYRRLFVLLLIGLAHGYLIWFGDILASYALFGFLLPLFFNRKPKTIIIWAISILGGVIILLALISGLNALLPTENALNDVVQKTFEDYANRAENSLQAYGNGTFSEIMTQRISDTNYAYSNAFATIFIIFPLFLLGLFVGKKGIFQNIEENLSLIKKTWILGLTIGLTISILSFIWKKMASAESLVIDSGIIAGVSALGNVGICLFIMTSIVLLYRNQKWMLKLKPLAYMGRMALSNYLFQSIVCTTIFYNFGLGLYGKVGTALCFVLTIVIYTTQIYISKYWFKHFQFGPMEWIWKSLTYGKFFKMKL